MVLFGVISGHFAAAQYVMTHMTISAAKTAEENRDMASVTLFGQSGQTEMATVSQFHPCVIQIVNGVKAAGT